MNDVHLADFRLVRKGAFDLTINSTMYLRKTYALSTKITRHRWARRKHLYSWISLSNVLKDWAKTYRFYRKYNKFISNQYFTKHTLISFNLVSSLNSIPCLHKGSEDVVAAPVTRRTLRYFNYLANPRLRFLINNKHLARVLISYDAKYLDLGSSETQASFVPLYVDTVTRVIPYYPTTPALKRDLAQGYLDLASWSFVNSTLTIKSLYRSCVLLTYKRL